MEVVQYNFKESQVTKRLVGLVVFYCISIVVGYLMPNSVYTYILGIYNL